MDQPQLPSPNIVCDHVRHVDAVRVERRYHIALKVLDVLSWVDVPHFLTLGVVERSLCDWSVEGHALEHKVVHTLVTVIRNLS